MKNINNLAPILRFFFPGLHLISGQRLGKNLIFFNLCKDFVPEVKFDINNDFPFNPKQIPKVPQRHVRKACYQSFSLYKKSYQPERKPRIRLIKDEGFTFWGEKQEVSKDSVFNQVLEKGLLENKDEAMQGFDDLSRFMPSEFYSQFMNLPIKEVPIDQRLTARLRTKQ